MPEDIESAPEKTGPGAAVFFSPEFFVMLLLAIVLDIAGLICLILNIAFGVGEVISFMVDAIGIAIFGLWMIFMAITGRIMAGAKKETNEAERPEENEGPEETGGVAQKAAQRRKEISQRVRQMKERQAKIVKAGRGMGRLARFGLATLGELIPFVGALPFWTIMIISEFRAQAKQ